MFYPWYDYEEDNTTQPLWHTQPPPLPPSFDEMTPEEMEELTKELTELAKESLEEAKDDLGITRPLRCTCGAKHDIAPIHYSWCDLKEDPDGF